MARRSWLAPLRPRLSVRPTSHAPSIDARRHPTRTPRWPRAIFGALCFGAAAALLMLMSTEEGEWLFFPVGILLAARCLLVAEGGPVVAEEGE